MRSPGFHADELFSRVATQLRRSQLQLAYRPLRRALRLGCLLGLLPFTNAFASSSSSSLTQFRVQKLSIPYICSLVLLVYKLLTLGQFWILQSTYGGLSGVGDGAVDRVATALAFYFTFCAGPYTHLLCLAKLKAFLTLLRAVEAFDATFHANSSFAQLRERLCVSRWFVAYNLLTSIAVVFTPVYILYQVASAAQHRPTSASASTRFYLLPGVVGPSDALWVCVFVSVVYVVLESGNVVAYFQMHYVTKLLTSRLDALTELVEWRVEKKGSTPPSTSSSKCGGVESWRDVGRQCSEWLSLHERYVLFIGTYFVTLSGVLMTSYVCMLYFLLTSTAPVAEECDVPLLVVVNCAMGRVVGMMNAGEALLVKYRRLHLALWRAWQQEAFEASEEAELEGCLELVTTTRVCTSAWGFFAVSRTNIPSMVSLVLTYLVVLFQFKDNSRNHCSSTHPPRNLSAPPAPENGTTLFSDSFHLQK